MEQYIDEFGNLQFKQPSNNFQFKSMVDMANENENFMDQFNFPGADLNNVPVKISQRPIASIPNNFLNYRFQEDRTPFTPVKEGITTIKDKALDFLGSGKELALRGIGSIFGGPVGGFIGGALANLKETPEQKAMKDFYEKEFGLTDTGQVRSGIMQGYNPVSIFGGTGLNQAIDKRIAKITQTLAKQKKNRSKVLENRLKELKELRAKESAAASAALEAQRRGRRPGTSGGGGGVKDSGGPTGGYSYDRGGREGFGYGL